MAGLFNTGIRDYCGEESSITKLSNHFSKDYAFHQEGINENNSQTVSNPMPTTFNFCDLLKDVINDNNNCMGQTTMKCERTNPVIDSKNTVNIDHGLINADQWNYPSLYVPPGNYFPVANFPMAPNVIPMQFIPPDPCEIAKQWAQDELSKFDNKIISESDLNHPPAVRFIDVLQDLVNHEDQFQPDFLNDSVSAGDSQFYYDLDADLRQMRDRVDSNADASDRWAQITKSLQETADEMNFTKTNHYHDELQNSDNSEDIDKKVEAIFQQGVMLFQKGDFFEANLAFEAVVQMKPEFESGWSYLGMSLSENEQDYRAIIACKKCLELNKSNRQVLLSLARIYCNEMNLSATIDCLEQWLLSNPKYSDLATIGQQVTHSTELNPFSLDDMYEIAFESSGKFSIIDEQLNLALSRNQFDIDPELEIAAGTLYHAAQDYNRATARFEAAVNVIKDNACLWNKLGTAHCNAGNYEKSINAYRKALELAPAFARAECNIGVAFYNTESYKEAMEHAIRACKIQHVDNVDIMKENYDSIMESDPIWTLIRMSGYKLDRPDLDAFIFSRDIDALSKEFGV